MGNFTSKLLAGVLLLGSAMSVHAETVPLRVVIDFTDSAGTTVATGTRSVALVKDNVRYAVTSKAFTDTTFNVEPGGTWEGFCIFKTAAGLRAERLVGQFAYDIVEGVKVDSAATITFSMKHCKNRIGISPVFPNGEKYDGGNYDAATKTYWESHPRNYKLSTYQMVIRDHKVPLSASYSSDNMDRHIFTDSVLTDYNGVSVLISDASDNFTYSVAATVIPLYDPKQPVAFGFAKSGFSGDVVLENKVSDFVKLPVKIRSSKQGRGNTRVSVGAKSHFGTGGVGGTTRLDASDQDSTGTVARTYWGVKVLDGYRYEDEFPFNAEFVNVDYYGPSNPGTTSKSLLNQNPPVMVIKDGRFYTQKLHPSLCYYADEIGGTLGNNVPVTLAKLKGYLSTTGAKLFKPSITTIGRYGEVCETAPGYSIGTISLADSLLYSGPASTAALKVSSLLIGKTGRAQVAVTDEQFMVDTLSGKSTTTLSFSLDNDDFTPPTLTMLQLRDKTTGMVTDRFAENSADDELLLTAADFNYVTSTAYNVYRTRVQASCAPMGTTDWTEIPVTEIADSYNGANGYAYVGNLADVKAKSASKWYDLKVVVTDSAGNTQEQVLSPAFRIETIAQTSVAQVSTEKTVQSVRYYNLQGQQSATPFEGVNIKLTRYTDGTTSSQKVLK